MVTETIWFSRVWYHRGLRYLHNSAMNHVKYLRARPAEMPFRNWYTANTNHLKLTDSVLLKLKTKPD